MRNWFFSIVLGAGVTLPGAAFAIDFDEVGKLSFDSRATIKLNFDNATDVTGLAKGTGDPIEGTGFAFVQSNQQSIKIPLSLPKQNKRYVARMFARDNRVVGTIDIGYDDATLPDSSAHFFPTGRVTSDGWYEIETAAFSLEGSKPFTATLSLFASGAGIDAFEVVESGAFRPITKCSGHNDSVCASNEFCAASYCRDGNLAVPQLPRAEDRVNTAKYLAARLRLFFGGRLSRERALPVAEKTLEKAEKAQSAWEFWNSFATAMHQLHDWHTKMQAPLDVRGRGAFPICVVEGDADLSHNLAPAHPTLPDVIVSHVGSDLNSGLKPGDRIVAVNGQHPIEFVENLEDVDWSYWRANDPQTHAEAAERLRFTIRRWAKDITVIRCNPTNGTCSAPETIFVESLPTTEPNDYPECDHRPTYLIDGPDAASHSVSDVFVGPVRGVPEAEKIYGMVWNSVYLQPGDDNPYATPLTTLRQNAKGVILDHRTGNGGTELAAEYLTSLFRSKVTLGASTGFLTTVGLLDAPFTPADGLTLIRQRGGSDIYQVGADDARGDLKTALLLARDGSASDWFPEGMKNSGANVRIFGRRTAGAFSSFIQFDYYSGVNWQFASGDYIREDGRSHIGEGVLPDEDILPKQSDLLVGRDTVVERALAWIRE